MKPCLSTLYQLHESDLHDPVFASSPKESAITIWCYCHHTTWWPLRGGAAVMPLEVALVFLRSTNAGFFLAEMGLWFCRVSMMVYHTDCHLPSIVTWHESSERAFCTSAPPWQLQVSQFLTISRRKLCGVVIWFVPSDVSLTGILRGDHPGHIPRFGTRRRW